MIPETPHDPRARANIRGAATAARRAKEERIERLRDIRAQVASGSLVIRQMTPTERAIANEDARQAATRNEQRRRNARLLANSERPGIAHAS